MTRTHLQLTQRRTLPLSLASNGTDRVVYNDQPAKLTLLETEERCHDCPWPTTCEQDRTCWQQETAQASQWQRSHVDLPRTDRTGSNTWTRDEILHAVRGFHQRTGRSPGAADFQSPMPGLSSVYRHWATVNELQDAAGVPPHPTRLEETQPSTKPSTTLK